MRIWPIAIAGVGGLLLLLTGRKALAATPTGGNVSEDAKIKKIVASANKYGIPPAVALAIADVESGGSSGFAKDGRMIIRFEPKTFDNRYMVKQKKPTGMVPADRGGQAKEWAMFDKASAIDPIAAKKSISMGMFQIMGFNYDVCNYPNVDEMFKAFSTSQDAQIQGFFDFCSKITGDAYENGPQIKLDKAARAGNFLVFARGYNGRGQKGYDVKMKKRYDYWVKKGYAGIGSGSVA
jgi:hypothetical protein